MLIGYTIDVVIALSDDMEQPMEAWWADRFEQAVIRAGGMPAEVADPSQVKLQRQTDPDNGDQFACVTFPLPTATPMARARELAHMLISVLAADGYTLRRRGRRIERVSGKQEGDLEATLGDLAYTEARVYAKRCLGCVFASEHRIGCCGQGAAFSLADIGAALLAGDDEFVAQVLALPAYMDEEKWHTHLKGGACIFHDPSRGCTLPPNRMPLQCRTYLCAPEQLLPMEVLVDYTPYVDALDEAEAFIGDHMRDVSRVNFGSSIAELKEAAAKAFAAWAAGE